MGGEILLKARATRVEPRPFDQAAFDALYNTYLPKVYNYICYRVGDSATAEDLTAEVFERALSRWHTYQAEKGAFSTWIFTIAHNLVANHARARKRRPEEYSLEVLPEFDEGTASPEQAVAAAEQLRQIQAKMSLLPEQQQEVLALKFGSGLENQEIAAALGIKPNHVGVLLHRAVRALRLALAQEEMEV
jgi:RNA polymerase sigma factor (sigma-70 family)